MSKKFDESKIKRASDGRFGSKSGGSSKDNKGGTISPKTRSEVQSLAETAYGSIGSKKDRIKARQALRQLTELAYGSISSKEGAKLSSIAAKIIEREDPELHEKVQKESGNDGSSTKKETSESVLKHSPSGVKKKLSELNKRFEIEQKKGNEENVNNIVREMQIYSTAERIHEDPKDSGLKVLLKTYVDRYNKGIEGTLPKHKKEPEKKKEVKKPATTESRRAVREENKKRREEARKYKAEARQKESDYFSKRSKNSILDIYHEKELARGKGRYGS